MLFLPIQTTMELKSKQTQTAGSFRGFDLILRGIRRHGRILRKEVVCSVLQVIKDMWDGRNGERKRERGSRQKKCLKGRREECEEEVET